MIIACPACATRYVVPDSAIGLEGRTVRCAKCKHSWFQDGPDLAAPPAALAEDAAAPPARGEAAPPPPAPDDGYADGGYGDSGYADDGFDRREDDDEGERPAPPPLADPAPAEADGGSIDDEEARPAFAAPPVPREWAPAGAQGAADEDEDYSQFDRTPPFRPRRNWLRWLTWGAAAFAAAALAAVAALSTLGAPSWLPIEKPLFGADPGLTVEFPASEQERRTLPNGAEFFGARVVVKNDGRETRRVPPLLIVLRDARETVVYSWELVPPQSTLDPGEAMTINEAMTDVPKSAVYADIGWAPR